MDTPSTSSVAEYPHRLLSRAAPRARPPAAVPPPAGPVPAPARHHSAKDTTRHAPAPRSRPDHRPARRARRSPRAPAPSPPPNPPRRPRPPATPAAELRLGYFPNVTHASAILGVEQGLFSKELGGTKLTTQTFNAGGDAVNALLGGSLDATFIGSGPAINAFAKSDGQAVRLIAGATAGGAQLVVKPEITSPAQLKGKTLATPQKGNTQDIALKKWLGENGLTAGDGPDDVKIANLDNPRTLDAFKQGTVDGGWLPEPWSSRLVLDAGASVLLDEATLWPNGKFPTTVLVVRTEFLQQYPDTVRALLRGHLKAIDADHGRTRPRPRPWSTRACRSSPATRWPGR